MGKGYFLSLTTALFLAGSAATAYAAAEKYTLDPTHTTVVFFIKHAGFSDMVGVFRTIDGTLMLDHDAPEKSSVNVSIDPASVETSSKRLDFELQGEKYFNRKKYASIQFKSTRIELTGKNTAKLTGKLSMLGAIQPITLTVQLNKEGELFTQQRIGFSGKGELKRSSFGMLEAIPLVADRVTFQVEAEFTKE